MSAQVALEIKTKFQEVTSSTIWLKWHIPHDQDRFEYFEVKYIDIETRMFCFESTVDNEITLYNLKSNMEYTVKVYSVLDNGDIRLIINKVIRTKPSSTQAVIEQSNLVHRGPPPVYKLPCFVHLLDTNRLRECHLVSKYQKPLFRDGTSREKTILVVGATGSGKSSFIDAMINYIVGVSLQDNCRFQAVDPTEDEKPWQQYVSQTSTTTCYRIPHHDLYRIDYALNIIDTPGFNNTGGKIIDQNIPIQVKQVFESIINNLHAVCLVVPSCQSRFNEAERWGFENILGLFDADITKITYPCLTFYDGGKDMCLRALEGAGIQFEKYFSFENSNVHVSSTNERSFQDLLSKIDKNVPHCMTNSKIILRTSENIFMQLVNNQDKIRSQVQIVNTIKYEEKILRDFHLAIESNKEFTYEECISKKIKKIIKKQTVICTECKESCHKKCNAPKRHFLSLCEAFSSGKCTVCSNKCKTDNHVLENYEYETVYLSEKRTREDLERKYNDAVEGQQKHTRMMQNEKLELQRSLLELIRMLEIVKKLIISLNDIALKDNFSFDQYLDELIDVENETRQDGFSARIDLIRKMKIALDKDTSLDELIQQLYI